MIILIESIVLCLLFKWFCHDKYFVLKGTEDMVDEYHNYLFHFKGFLFGECLALIICLLAGTIIQFIL